MKIIVTFFKPVTDIRLREHQEKVCFEYQCDDNKSYAENCGDAYSEAVKRGHNPYKQIRFKAVE